MTIDSLFRESQFVVDLEQNQLFLFNKFIDYKICSHYKSQWD